jgi:hypothetical protein
MKKRKAINACIGTGPNGLTVGLITTGDLIEVIKGARVCELRRHESVNKWTLYYRNSQGLEFQITCDTITSLVGPEQIQKLISPLPSGIQFIASSAKRSKAG